MDEFVHDILTNYKEIFQKSLTRNDEIYLYKHDNEDMILIQNQCSSAHSFVLKDGPYSCINNDKRKECFADNANFIPIDELDYYHFKLLVVFTFIELDDDYGNAFIEILDEEESGKMYTKCRIYMKDQGITVDYYNDTVIISKIIEQEAVLKIERWFIFRKFIYRLNKTYISIQT